MDTHVAAEKIKGQLEILILETIIDVLNRLTDEMTMMKKKDEMKF